MAAEVSATTEVLTWIAHILDHDIRSAGEDDAHLERLALFSSDRITDLGLTDWKRRPGRFRSLEVVYSPDRAVHAVRLGHTPAILSDRQLVRLSLTQQH